MAEKQITANERTAKKLIKLMKGKDIAQISISNGTSHISVKQKTAQPKVITAPIQPAVSPQPEAAPETNIPTSNTEAIKAENVGTFHLTLKGKVLAEAGKTYEKGARLAHINAIKIDNDVKAPFKCIIKKILVEENKIVEYGTPLFEVERA